MNKQLRKAIREATMVVDIFELYDKHQADASQAKLLRVIELLVEQRDDAITREWMDHEYENARITYDAELIAALEGKT
jgi:transposase-like protein